MFYTCSTYDLRKHFGLEFIKRMPAYKLYNTDDHTIVNFYLHKNLWVKYRELANNDAVSLKNLKYSFFKNNFRSEI